MVLFKFRTEFDFSNKFRAVAYKLAWTAMTKYTCKRYSERRLEAASS